MSKWISVKDEYPNEMEEVIVTDGEDYAIGWYREDADAWEHSNYGWLERESDYECPIRLGKITHWRRFERLKTE